ncbi:sensor histidine kinase [Psychroserpens sp.]|uniref:sensor histidine kinase n=1 Tax=Psychroserpens sp. TaxID=2020870 RepID=UPI002B277C73|nr:histidine kinase dimerization/phosphoacceptor domain -containing protein [Psychroserpens sp.]
MLTYNNLRRATYYSDPNSSKSYTKKFLETAIRVQDSFNISLGNFYLGNANVVSSNFEVALTHYLASANYFEKVKDSARLSSVFNGIGAAYENSGNDSLSLNYFIKSQQISYSIGDLRRSAIALTNIGNIYKYRGDLENAKSYMEQAVVQIKTTNRLQYIHSLTLNLANIYVELKDYDDATPLFEEVLTTVDTINDVYIYGASLRGLGNVALERKDYSDGLRKIKKAYKKLKSSGFFDEALATMPDLILAYELNGQYKNGLMVANQYQKLTDSIFSNEKDKNLTEALQKYEAEKKDTELKLLKVETEKKEQQNRLYFILAIAGLFIASLLGYFSFKNRQKNKTLANQKKLLENTLDEKNTLLKEVHHRVKNSFQIVSSLLYLQSENMEGKEAKIAIKEAENRVRSMVLVHQKLYSKDELVGINTKEYISDLVKDIVESHQFNSNLMDFSLNIESHVLDIETITPLGLILNELIINTLKHAFSASMTNPKIDISFIQIDDAMVLMVSDNGKGFEGKIKQTSFGISLLKALSKTLKANLEYSSIINKGTSAVLTIKKFKILT